jgi:hypothetical protein
MKPLRSGMMRELLLAKLGAKMKAKGFNTAVICEVTGLSEAEVEGLD